MLQEHAKLITFFSECKELVGRKRLQKMIYILKKCQFPFSERYQFHFYGPYSEELTLRVQELINLGFLQEEKEKKSGYYQYRYTLTGEGEKFLDHYNLDMPNMDEHIEKMSETSSRFLELVSTMLFFEGMPKEEVEEKVLTVKKKQNYTSEELQQAWNFIGDMGIQH
ncbi:YwgA family protein [Salinibacillus xinjiangensis]|uniref:YwgA family protein n=1 Tax=Salinibacillus xinjiangensis TaxID=1229268 RepID=A0A6G1X5N0_9BACI|nr:YwgA family protein [Salinibacillus xinjiangensis]MRG86247.1 YwgA family protein [Salinibacillus xinjiangensis]